MVVDTTGQSKVVAVPTDARLLPKAIAKLANLAKRYDVAFQLALGQNLLKSNGAAVIEIDQVAHEGMRWSPSHQPTRGRAGPRGQVDAHDVRQAIPRGA